jgi:DeoR/GlpR family transcriptional regulator of sugar metabolism
MPEEIPAARLARMRWLLDEHGVLSSRQARAEFGVSEMTVRRDFTALVRAGHAARTRGGIVRTDRFFPDRPQEQRLKLEPEAKSVAARLAAPLVQDGDAIFIGGGTTCLALARELSTRQGLTIITYSVSALLLLMANPALEVFASGGLASPRGDDMTGPLAEAALRGFRAQKAFISASGITADGIFNAHVARGSADATLVQQAGETYVLADHTKIGRVSLVTVAGLDRVRALVTDRPVPEDDGQWLSEAGVQVIAPDRSGDGSDDLPAPGPGHRASSPGDQRL